MKHRVLALFGVVLLAACQDTAQITQPEGAGSPLFSTSPPSALTFQSVSAGRAHSCGLTTVRTAYCWGFNGFDQDLSSGRLGDGTNTASNVPVAVSGGLTFQSVGAGSGHSCGVTTAGYGYC